MELFSFAEKSEFSDTLSMSILLLIMNLFEVELLLHVLIDILFLY